VTVDTWLWYAARVAALSAFVVLAASLLTGMAVRAGYLGFLARNRAVTSLHGFLAWFWVPLVGVHVTCLLLDATAQIRPVDLVIPFQVSYAPLAVGLGTVGLLLLALLAITSALRRYLPARLWIGIHRLSYPTFVLFMVHAQLAGTDFSSAWVSVAGWTTVGALTLLTLPRLAGARMAAARGPAPGGVEDA
jgi:DMSO/TMAO reductase YedYZ heme-binding membrane subunit